MDLRALIVMLLFIGASAALVMIVFVLNFLLALRGAQGIDPLQYVLILSAHCFAGVAIGFPVTIRMASLSEADRLERVFLDAKQRRDISS